MRAVEPLDRVGVEILELFVTDYPAMFTDHRGHLLGKGCSLERLVDLEAADYRSVGIIDFNHQVSHDLLGLVDFGPDAKGLAERIDPSVLSHEQIVMKMELTGRGPDELGVLVDLDDAVGITDCIEFALRRQVRPPPVLAVTLHRKVFRTVVRPGMDDCTLHVDQGRLLGMPGDRQVISIIGFLRIVPRNTDPLGDILVPSEVAERLELLQPFQCRFIKTFGSSTTPVLCDVPVARRLLAGLLFIVQGGHRLC